MGDGVRRHYDSLSVPTRRERSSGPAAELKRVHNAFKSRLIQRFARNANFLVDIGCGRGGDIGKWRASGVANVLGFDNSESQVAEATRRAQEAGVPGYVFETTYADVAEALSDIPDGCADAVTSMFSLNYFFGSRAEAEALLVEVRRVLRPNGTFFGVFASGAEVRRLYAEPELRETSAYVVRAVDGHLGPFPCFGEEYSLLLRDTVLDLDGSGAPTEFAVDRGILESSAAAAGLRVEAIPDDLRTAAFESIRDADYRRASSLYESFAFRRVDAPGLGSPT